MRRQAHRHQGLMDSLSSHLHISAIALFKSYCYCVSFFRNQNGIGVEKGDIIVEIDDQAVNVDNVVRLLRGSDIIGSVVKMIIEKCNEPNRIPFEFQRADMRGILKLKNLYIALAGCIFHMSAVTVLLT